MQPPSLFFEDYKNIDIYKKILRKIIIKSKVGKFIISNIKSENKIKKLLRPKSLKPFNYFLFNASIDLRKNVLLLIKSFIKSDAQKKESYL